MSVTNERLVLSSLVKNTTFSSKTLPFIKPDYFGDDGERLVFSIINEYTAKYNDLPNKSVLHVNLQNSPKIGESQLEVCVEIVNDIFDIIPPENTEWLVETTEKWCRDRAIYNAINESFSSIRKRIRRSRKTPFRIFCGTPFLLLLIAALVLTTTMLTQDGKCMFPRSSAFLSECRLSMT